MQNVNYKDIIIVSIILKNIHMKKAITWLIVGAAIFTMGWCYTNGGRIEDVDGNDSICPRCKSDSIATIMYGLLSEREIENPDSFREEMRKRRMVAGGCVVGPEKHSCYNCGYRWPRYFSE